MLRFATTFALALAATAAAIPAQSATLPAAPLSVVDRDGVRVSYSSTLLADDTVAIHGVDLETREPLDLTLDQRGRVLGMSGFSQVAFTIPVVARDAIVADLKQSAAVANTAAPGTTIEASLR